MQRILPICRPLCLYKPLYTLTLDSLHVAFLSDCFLKIVHLVLILFVLPLCLTVSSRSFQKAAAVVQAEKEFVTAKAAVVAAGVSSNSPKQDAKLLKKALKQLALKKEVLFHCVCWYCFVVCLTTVSLCVLIVRLGAVLLCPCCYLIMNLGAVSATKQQFEDHQVQC